MDIEQKLCLIRQMHREQEEQERYYGRDFRDREIKSSGFSSLRFRLLVSMLLFLCFFVMDKKDIVCGKIDSSKIIEYIECNPEMKELMSYFTLETD